MIMKNTLKIMCIFLSVAAASVHGIDDENTPGIVGRTGAYIASAAGTGLDYASSAGSWISWPFTTVWDWTYKPSAAYNAMKFYAGNHDLRAKNAKYADNYKTDGSLKQEQAFFSLNGWLSLSLVKDAITLAPARFVNEKAARYYAQCKGYDNDQTVKLMDKYSGFKAGVATTVAAAGLYYLYKKNVHGKIKNRARNAFLSAYGVKNPDDRVADFKNYVNGDEFKNSDITQCKEAYKSLKNHINKTLSKGTMVKDLMIDGANAIRNGFNYLAHEAQKAMNADKKEQASAVTVYERKQATQQQIDSLFVELEKVGSATEAESVLGNLGRIQANESMIKTPVGYAEADKVVADHVKQVMKNSGITMPVGYASVLEMYVKMHLMTKNNQSEPVKAE